MDNFTTQKKTHLTWSYLIKSTEQEHVMVTTEPRQGDPTTSFSVQTFNNSLDYVPDEFMTNKIHL